MSENNFVKLGDVAHECRLTWSGGQTDIPIVGLEHLVPGEIELSSWDSNIEHTFSKKFLKGQVLLGRRRVYLKKAVVAPCDGICSGDITVIESTGGILPELLPFVIQNDRFFDYAMQGSAGSLSPRVKWEHLKNYEFPLPPLTEQKVLADKLWAAYRLKESYKKLLAATEEMVKSQFIEMTGDPRTNPKGWPVKTLPELATYSIGLTYKPENISEEGTIVLRSGNIQNSKIDLADVVRVNCPIKESIYVQKNDILMCSRNGSAALVGKVAMIKDIPEPMTYGAFMTVIRSEYSDYLYLYFQSNDFREQVSTGKSSTMNQITQNMLDKISLPLPDDETRKKLSIILHQADKSGFDGRKSQFIEMFGSGNWPEKRLGEVGSFTRGGGFQKSDYVEHGIPCIHYGQIHTKFGPFISSHITEISSDLESKTKFASKGDVIIAITSEDTEGSCKSTAWLGDYSVAVGGHAAIYKHSMNPLYMTFFLHSTLFNHAKMEYVHGTKVFEIRPDDIAKILVPCPPISLQEKFATIAHQADKSGSVLLKLSSR